MAQSGPEANVFAQAINADDLNKGAYIHNMYARADHVRLRSGFGQVHQFDSTLGMSTPSTSPFEYLKHLGSRMIQTGFGNEQIVSVFLVNADTGCLFNSAVTETLGRYAKLNLVHIYDLTTDESWEEVVYLQTAQTVKSMVMAFGMYETNLTNQFENYPKPSEKMCFFAEYNGALIFGNEDLGLLSYQPASFSGFTYQQLNGISYDADTQRFYSESSLIVPIVPNPGVFGVNGKTAGAYKYFDSASFPKVVDGVDLMGRMCYIGTDGLLYFADINYPGSIAGPNFIPIRANANLTAVEQINGNLLVFSEHETYLYQPTGTDIISGGGLIKLSDSVGCLNQNSITNANGVLFWTDRNGAYISQNGTDVKPLMDGIKSFWKKDEGIAVPLTNYYQAVSAIGTNANSIRMQYAFNDADDAVHVAYSPKHDFIMLVCPVQAMALVFDGAGWKIWSWESCDGDKDSGILLNTIQHPWIATTSERICLVGSTDNLRINDSTMISGSVAANEDINSDSYYLLEYGRGGNTDRSIEYQAEDDRLIAGKYYVDSSFQQANDGCDVIIERWIKVPVGYRMFAMSETAPENTYYLPIELRAPTDTPIEDLEIEFEFDNLHWRPLFTSSVSDVVSFDLPPERVSVETKYTVRCVDGAGIPSRNGNAVNIVFNGTIVGDFVVTCKEDNRVPFILIPMIYIGNATHDCVSMGIKFKTAEWTTNNGEFTTTQYASAIYWQQALFNSRHTDDEGQSIDWCVKSDQTTNGENQIKVRGLYLRTLTHGVALGLTGTDNQFGQRNLLVAADWSDWSAQIIDFSNDSIHEDSHDDPFDRVNKPTTDLMTGRTFGNANATWGSSPVPATGNYLIDNEQYDSVAFSTSVKGDSVSVMAFGHIRDKAEDIRINEMVVSVREGGGRRRVGR